MSDDMENIPLSDNDSGTEVPSNSHQGDHSPEMRPSGDHWRSAGSVPDVVPEGLRQIEGVYGIGADLIEEAEETSEADREEKQRLIREVLELQHTLEDLSSRVDAVKEENLKLRSENQILGQYIENLMAASSVFQSASPKARRRGNQPMGSQSGRSRQADNGK